MSENMTYVRGALWTTAREAGHSLRDELEGGPGHGPCHTTRRFARRLGRRAKNRTNAISKARDRSGPALYKSMFSDRTDSTSINATARPRSNTSRPPPWPWRKRLAKRALLSSLSWTPSHSRTNPPTLASCRTASLRSVGPVQTNSQTMERFKTKTRLAEGSAVRVTFPNRHHSLEPAQCQTPAVNR